MSVTVLLLLITLFVAYANGANDNFKGVATLYGANVTDYKKAILIGTVATFAGCIASVFLAEGLVKAFSGKGLVPDAIAASPIFLLSVATGAGLTVILATRLGFPISTTHGLTGALVGAGFLAAGEQLNLSALGSTFFFAALAWPNGFRASGNASLHVGDQPAKNLWHYEGKPRVHCAWPVHACVELRCERRAAAGICARIPGKVQWHSNWNDGAVHDRWRALSERRRRELCARSQ